METSLVPSGVTVLADVRSLKAGEPHVTLARVILKHIKALIKARHGSEECDTDDGEAYLKAALPQLIVLQRKNFGSEPFKWAKRHTRRLVETPNFGKWLANEIDMFIRSPRFHTKEELGQILRVND